MEDKSKKQEELALQLNNRLLQQLEENIKLIEELENQRDFNITLIQSTSVFFVAIEANGKLLMMNDPMLKALGYTKKEVLGKDYLTTLVPANERNKLSKIFEKLSRLHQRTFNENHVLAKDGRLLLVEWHGAPILKGKEFDYFIGLGIDITEQKQAENKIRESQQRMANHLENTPLAAIFWDLNFKVTDWNRSAEEIYGYSKAEALGKHASELIVPEELKENINNIFNHLLSQTGGYRGTNENVTKDGKRILCNWYNVAITDTSGKVTGVASLVDDITIRKRNIDELKKSESKFKLLLENLPNAVFLTKLGGVNAGEIIYANPAAEKQTGYKKSKLIGMNIINDFLVEQETKLLKDKRENDLINDKILSFIEKKKRADSSVYTTRVMITSIEYENEKVNLSVNTDITEQVEAQAKVIESEKKTQITF